MSSTNSSTPPRRRDNASAILAETVPLVVVDTAPIVRPETDDDELDDREVVESVQNLMTQTRAGRGAPLTFQNSTVPQTFAVRTVGNHHRSQVYPGIDDGFFDKPKAPDNTNDEPDGIPDISPRAGPDGGSEVPDEVDGVRRPELRPVSPGRLFPYAPGYGHDLENGTIPDLESIPDVNVYQHKKTLAQGMMDLALFSANANQLRYVLESFNRHPYYYPSLILITISLLFQVAVGIGLIWNATYNVKDSKEICIANKISNFTIIGIFLVTVINVFISAFGVANVS